MKWDNGLELDGEVDGIPGLTFWRSGMCSLYGMFLLVGYNKLIWYMSKR